MFAMLSLAVGILLGMGVIYAFRNRLTALPWWTLILGLAGAAALFGATQLNRMQATMEFPAWLLSILLSFAAVIVGVQAMRKGQTTWAAWVGLIAGVAGAGFWVWFALANALMGG
jgi:hypothetical protein